MRKISCDMCMDLMPLVADQVASTDSVQAVREHLESCERCRAVFQGSIPPGGDLERSFDRVKKKLRLFLAMVLMFGVLYGLSLTGGNSLFYNVVLMPAIGALGYGLFRWKALWEVPILLLITHSLSNLLGLGREIMPFVLTLQWSGIYSLFTILGTVIAGLLHFALRKEKTP